MKTMTAKLICKRNRKQPPNNYNSQKKHTLCPLKRTLIIPLKFIHIAANQQHKIIHLTICAYLTLTTSFQVQLWTLENFTSKHFPLTIITRKYTIRSFSQRPVRPSHNYSPFSPTLSIFCLSFFGITRKHVVF